jgi:hypothetical protein
VRYAHGAHGYSSIRSLPELPDALVHALAQEEEQDSELLEQGQELLTSTLKFRAEGENEAYVRDDYFAQGERGPTQKAIQLNHRFEEVVFSFSWVCRLMIRMNSDHP